VHSFEAAGDGVTGTAGVRVLSDCNPLPSTPCDGVPGIIFGDSCRMSNGYADSERTTFPASHVAFTDTEVLITFDIDELGSVARGDLVAGTVVRSVWGGSMTGIGSTADGSRMVVDNDFAFSNGSSYTFG
jgi:hypothetical protein